MILLGTLIKEEDYLNDSSNILGGLILSGVVVVALIVMKKISNVQREKRGEQKETWRQWLPGDKSEKGGALSPWFFAKPVDLKILPDANHGKRPPQSSPNIKERW